jgi:hypothetical protein
VEDRLAGSLAVDVLDLAAPGTAVPARRERDRVAGSSA